MSTKIYINGELLGYCDNPISFTQEMREKRRKGKISHQMNITYYDETNEICIYTDPGRARRPLIIVKNGIPLLNEEHLNKVAKGIFNLEDLIKRGIIEFLDADEEENSYIAMTLSDLTDEHTHLEIDPATMLGICAGVIPFSDHNSSPRNTMEAGMIKQALGLYVSNYAMRTEVRSHLLHHPQTPIVKTRIIDSTNYDLRPSGQNFVVALMSYEGYNMEDAMVINKAALERGLARSSFFRSYDTSEKRYAGGQVDRFEIPDRRIKGYRSEEAYRNLDDDGMVNPESEVYSGDVLVGKTSPPRFLEEDFGTIADRRRETSITVKHGEKGIVDAVLLSETSEGSRLAKIRVRDTRQPELGDKFASRHGQKGVLGLILSPEDVPFTEFGVMPDLIVNPHAIPSRMSIGLVLEIIAGKTACLEGERVDATPFNKDIDWIIREKLFDNGFESQGCESFYNGVTGERFEAEIFVGVAYYQKLHHMTTDKVYARSRGPIQVLTRQPTEGRAREGGLRFGEMERDCLIAHGAALALKERLLDESDKYEAIVCANCGMLAVYDKNKNKIYCPICGDVDTYPVEMSYAFKLLLDEVVSLCVFPKLILGDKVGSGKPFVKKHSFDVKPLEENRNVISGIRLSDEEPMKTDNETQIEEKLERCEICGKKLNKNQKRVCKVCSRKQYASRIIKILVSVVKPGIPFKKQDLKLLNLDDLQIKDYMWTLQEFSLVDIDGNKFMLKDEDTLNDFRINSKFEPIDFNNLNSEDRLDKTCKTCGKTLPVSKFYKTSDGYEDNCKNCKKLIITANYLNDLVNNIGFGKEFTNVDLRKFIPNENQIMGIIWSLQDNDLLIESSPNQYVLAEKSKCIIFLDKYLDKSKSMSSDTKKEDLKEKEQMKSVLKEIKSGKTRKEAAKITNIPIDKITYWYNEGKQSSGKNNIEFYKRLKKIEDKLSKTQNKSLEKKQMDFVLKLLGQGKSMSQAANISGIKITKILSWVDQGRDNHSENTIYFYNEMNKIMIEEDKVKNNKSKKDSKKNKKLKEVNDKKTVRKKSKKKKVQSKASKTKDKVKSVKNNIPADGERIKMDVVLNALRSGKSRNDAAEEAGISVTKISSWEMNGNFRYSDNTIYFVNELNKINSDDEKTVKGKTKSKRDSNKSKNSKKETKKKKVQSKSSKTKRESQSEKKDASLDDERIKMDVVLNALRSGKSRNDAAEEAGISVTKISSWEMNGNLEYSKNTVYFIKELDKIRLDNEILSNIKNNYVESNSSSKSSNVKRDNLKNSNLSKTIKSAVDAINSLDGDNDNLNKDFVSNDEKSNKINKNNFDKNDTIKPKSIKKSSLNKNKTKIDESSRVDKIDLNDEKQVMDAILSLMRKGYSRVQAAQEVGIKVGQIVIWHMQGRKNHSKNTVYFYNQLNLIENK